MINGSLPLFVFEFFNTNIEEEEFLLGVLPPHISNSSVNIRYIITNTAGMRFKKRMNVCDQKLLSYFCQSSMRVAAHLIFRVVSHTELLIF